MSRRANRQVFTKACGPPFNENVPPPDSKCNKHWRALPVHQLAKSTNPATATRTATSTPPQHQPILSTRTQLPLHQATRPRTSTNEYSNEHTANIHRPLLTQQRQPTQRLLIPATATSTNEYSDEYPTNTATRTNNTATSTANEHRNGHL